MKRSLFFVLFAVAACILFSSCKKDRNSSEENLPALTSVVGYWVGKYGVKDNEPNFDYAFLIKPDSTLIVYSQSADTAAAKKAPGIWTFDKSTKKFTTYYAYSQDERYSTTGSLNHRSLTGTWGVWLNNSGGGKYTVEFKK